MDKNILEDFQKLKKNILQYETFYIKKLTIESLRPPKDLDELIA